MTFRKDWIEDFLCPRWCRAVESSLGIRKQESYLDEQERNKKGNKKMDIFGKKRIAELQDEIMKIRHSKDKIENCVNEYKIAIESLNDGIKSLVDEINAKVSDCKVGAWCQGCKYRSVTMMGSIEGIEQCANNPWVGWDTKYSKYYYCSKHLREICPEFENMKEE